MPLSRREIRTRAVKFTKQWAGASEEEADAKPFWYEFFHVFGIRNRTVGSYEVHVRKLDNALGKIDYFWPGMVLIEHKSLGKDLKKAAVQAADYLHGVKEHEKPRFILVSDFARFVLYDLENGVETELLLQDFPQRTELFDFIAGYEARPVREQDPVNIKAAELMGQLHDELKASGYSGKELEVYLVRLLFILFADDTGIFEQDAFYNFIVDQTREDGTDIGGQLARLFQLLNTPEEKRQKNLDERLADFKYINGKLFAEHLPIADWNGTMRVTLLECAGLNWSRISPAIFGALFQSAMDAKARRNLGAHYTSEANILKLIKPLFLDELWDEFEKAKRSGPKLENFHEKLSKLRFLDPACGCGNFLVITYRELRELEIAVITAQLKGQQVVDVDSLVLLNVDKFYGIEIEEFPAQIAQVAMWLIDHQMNQRVSAAFGEYMVRIPLRASATIACANALQLDWQSLLPEGERYDYILGNPPFIGSKLMTPEMRTDLLAIFPGVKGAGTLDYVSGWYGLAAHYVQAYGNKTTRAAFVSTNSITQGEQVGALWGPLLAKGIKIHFAHRTFRWNNEARGVAAVHCVIVGFADFDVSKKRLFNYADERSEPEEVIVNNLNPYLVDGPDVVIRSRSKPLCVVPEIGIGNKPIDGGNYLFTDEEKAEFIKLEPGSEKYFKRWLGSDEFINGWQRWCLWLGDAAPGELRQFPEVLKRIDAVRRVRLASVSAPTRKIADTPTRFHVENMPRKEYLIIPEVSSERRTFIPIGFETPNTLASNLVKILPDASLYHFGMLSCTMHNAWMRNVCGRMKSDYRYSKDIVYNNYPWPEQPTAAQKATVEKAAQGVLDARAQFPKASLADLYDPLTMPPALLKAHHALDKAVDKCYRPQPFTTDAKRVEFLFELYEKYVGGLLVESGKGKKRK
ncbi:MAG: class I SAM-dependent DNA methyltransferase [Flavobacteriales bacterium]|nr:class I SAM-dependent DNA methyltransferase [Flavobacteriales bacterium]MBK7241703.1 class I SAM-dependent DNA methyltransferase [Flavobacteriales bacterium]MBK9534858.1 class I SAM-dependent DNA methyltransferase [Flavobacteriales bacterium]MBP9137668.1 class I SAM-dependent DNA methyltransferase [Flavobacteriales bacterium]HQV53723.1 class I SAM-dependent DNA methyltransferase [Flavobacteriales bacterium]